MSLPDGYDTKVGSFGSRFSGGEKQRIAIARAILKNAPILILDEATSAADPENQVEIDKAIENLCKGKTVIVVAHRLGALKMCNRVAVVENHTITSVGTHDEVRQDNAYYNQAWTDYETARNITYQWKEVQIMRENPLKKNSRFYLGMVLNVVEGMLSGFNFLLLYEAMKMLWNGTINSPSLLRLSLFLGAFSFCVL